jgi:hypothetical protein
MCGRGGRPTCHETAGGEQEVAQKTKVQPLDRLWSGTYMRKVKVVQYVLNDLLLLVPKNGATTNAAAGAVAIVQLRLLIPGHVYGMIAMYFFHQTDRRRL